MSWKGVHSINECKFIIAYHLRDDKEFKDFEDLKLIGNPLFEDFFELENGDGAYVFNFNEYKSEFKKIIHGKYSKLSDQYKTKVLHFFKNHTTHHRYIESYVNPHFYFEEYEKLLNVPISILEKVGELCSLPDLKKEELKVKKKVLNFESVNNL
jgi:hypothetical protein